MIASAGLRRHAISVVTKLWRYADVDNVHIAKFKCEQIKRGWREEHSRKQSERERERKGGREGEKEKLDNRKSIHVEMTGRKQ